jgi:hypothetical protein
MKSAKEMERFGLDKFGIQVIKPSANFASRQKRFETGKTDKVQALISEEDRVRQVPGPGQYFKEIEWIHSKKSGGKGWV